MFVLTTFDPDAARRSLSAGLHLAEDEPGFMALYSAPSGWGIAPYSAFFVAVPVVGHDSPDGSRGYLMVEGYYSGRAGRIMHDHYNRRLGLGYSRQWNDGLDWFGEAGPGSTPVVNLRLRPVLPRPPTPLTAGVHHYLGEAPDGGLNIYSVAFSGVFHPVTEVEIEFNEHASPMLQSLKPIAIPYGSIISEAPLTFSPPRPISVSHADMAIESARMSLLDVLGRLGRPAALVTRQGRVAFVNEEAGVLLSGALETGHLRAWQRGDQARLDRTLELAVATGPANLADPVALAAPHRDRPVLVQALPVNAALMGEPGALLLFVDPTGPSRNDPTSALELLGLTRAEARVASAVGSGRSPHEAADELGLSVNTVRSALKLSYDKLGINRQSELARVVARLAG
jgi:DNA-binding CsgD family transcriptional regulator